MKKHLYSKFEKRNFLFVYLLIALPVVQFAVCWIYVNLSSIVLTFKATDGSFTFNNIKQVFAAFKGVDRYGLVLGESLLRSLTIWFVSHLLVFPISIITTYILQRRILGHYFWRLCYIIPGLMGSVIWITLMKYIIAYDGIVVSALTKMGVKLPEMVLRNGLLGAESTAFKTVMIIGVLQNLVGNNAVLTGAFARIPEEIYESAKLDGAGFWTECFRIAIPCIWSTIATLTTFALCSVFTADCGVFLYSNGTGEPGMSTVGFHLYLIQYRISLTGAGRASFGYPAALGFVLTCLTLPIVFGGKWLLERVDTVEV